MTYLAVVRPRRHDMLECDGCTGEVGASGAQKSEGVVDVRVLPVAGKGALQRRLLLAGINRYGDLTCVSLSVQCPHLLPPDRELLCGSSSVS